MISKESIVERFDELIAEGEMLFSHIDENREVIYIDSLPGDLAHKYTSWMHSCANLLRQITPHQSSYQSELERIFPQSGKTRSHWVLTMDFQRLLGMITSAKEEWDRGFLRDIEHIVVAETFDNFLDQADGYHKGGMKNEAAVLASAVLEDTFNKIAEKHALDSSTMRKEDIINKLVKLDVISQLQAKRAKALFDIRTSALHARWDAFDIKDVRQLIDQTRQFIEELL